MHMDDVAQQNYQITCVCKIQQISRRKKYIFNM